MCNILYPDTGMTLYLIFCHVRIRFCDIFDNSTWQYLGILILFVLKNYKIVSNVMGV